ncbi:MAG: cupin domain-containing protein [Sphingomonas bacterium]
MPFRNRRVVTGLNGEGKSCIVSDTTIDRIPGCNGIPVVAWQTDAYPISNAGNDECAGPFSAGTFGKSSALILFSPTDAAEPPAWHVTDTIDYVVVLTGRVLLEMETGKAELGPGDLIVDRGVVHSWRNAGAEPAVLAGVIIPAEPVQPGGHPEANFDRYIRE